MLGNEDSAIVIRDIKQASDVHAVEELQKEVWGVCSRAKHHPDYVDV